MTMDPPPLPPWGAPGSKIPPTVEAGAPPTVVMAAPPPPRRGGFFRGLWKFLVGTFAIAGLLTVLLFGGLIALALSLGGKANTVQADSVLYIDFEEPIPDEPKQGLLAALQPAATLQDTVEAIRVAAKDSRIKALVGRFGEQVLTLAQAQELSAAISDFNASEKPTYAFAESFGEVSSARADVYLSSFFKTVIVQPLGQVGLAPHAVELMHGKAALDRLQIGWQGGRREEFKTAMDPFTEPTPRPEEVENMQALLTDLDRQLFDTVATNRGISSHDLRDAVADSFPTDEKAKALKLIDDIEGWPDLRDRLARIGTGGTDRLVKPEHYRAANAAAFAARPGAKRIAVLHAGGMILRRSGNGGLSLSDETVTDARKMENAIQQIANDSAIQAVVLRVDSPGGSVTGSETVRQALLSLQGKPIVSSFGSVAASGGYWIATATDKIVADPATLTGSIGVVIGGPYLGAALEAIGITVTRVGPQEGPAGMFSGFHAMTPKEKAVLEAMLDRVYAAFLDHVANARGKSVEETRAIAKGRVYTGAQAKDIGLVDELGGLDKAIGIAKADAGIGAGDAVEIVHYPKAANPFEELTGGGMEALKGAMMLANLGRGLEMLGVLGPRVTHNVNTLALPESYEQLR